MVRRRDFLTACAATGLGVAAPVSVDVPCRADQLEPPPYEGPFYVVFNAAGGWDTTYLMDPKGVEGINRLYKEGEIQTHGNHHFAPIAKHIAEGLGNQVFFERYGDELLVFNGIDYSVNNHDPCQRYMATGKLDSLAYPTFAALVAGCKGASAPLAFLTFGNYSNTGNLVPMARVPYSNSLSQLAKADAIQGGKYRYHDDFVIDRIEQALQRKSMPSESAPLPRTVRAESMLYSAQANSKALARVAPFIPGDAPKNRTSQQIDIALAAFRGGACVSANLNSPGFDSHANNDRDQMKLIPLLLEAVDYLMTKAEELKIRDKLVVVMQSEMGRTPSYNKGDGKDHWSVGSIMFLGQGIKGNRVIGATDEAQKLSPINAKTLKTDRDHGIRVRPEHIHLALRQLAGIEQHAFSEQFPLAVAADEQLVGALGLALTLASYRDLRGRPRP